ncbi:APC family permease, partial [Streptococcus pluranimalium]
MFESFKNVLLGKPLKSDDGHGDSHLLSKSQALAMLSGDALSSIAYGPEQVILVLTTLSVDVIWWSLPIGIGVLILLISLIISYSQVIHAYPNGGAYMVSTENLSPNLGLLSGESLLIDYMLTVAVSVSSGADAITSAFTGLKAINIEISIVLILVLMLMNLRGLRESATALFIPVYFFIGAILILLVVGVFQIMTGDLAYHATSRVGSPVTGLSLFLLLRAFTSGSASLTGVEAISNAVPFFKKPKTMNAVEIMIIMSSILGIMFIGITFLNYWLGIVPSKDVTILAQIAQAVFGNSALGQV